MKPALIAAVLLSFCVYLAPRGERKQNPTNSEDEPRNNPPAYAAEVHSKSENQATRDKPLHWYKSSEWILVIVGIITAGVIGWQSFETRRAADAAARSVEAIQRQTRILERQAKAGEDAASAAKSNADTLINSERAWVLVSEERLADPTLRPTMGPPREEFRESFCEFFIENYGRSPAKILFHRAEMQIGKLGAPKDARIFDFDMSVEKPTPATIPQGKGKMAQAPVVPMRYLDPVEMAGISARKDFLWLCGFVVYQDGLQWSNLTLRVTKFCYLWDIPPGAARPCWTASGPEKYNTAD